VGVKKNTNISAQHNEITIKMVKFRTANALYIIDLLTQDL
jgi:hypothetical protein